MMEKLSDKECILKENIEKIKYNITNALKPSGRKPEDITLVAATKTVSSDVINIAIKNGINNIGENRVQELITKFADINTTNSKVHFIGHLQKNKVKDIVGKVDLIQSVDSLDLAKKISQLSNKLSMVTNILVEVNIGNDQNKFGIDKDHTAEILYNLSKLNGIKVWGLMSILPICENKKDLYKYFGQMRQLFIDIKRERIDNINMNFLSMGMSSDYIEALECGSNMVRIGSALFGARN